MTPERARGFLGDLSDVVSLRATTTVGTHGNAWVIWAEIGEYRRPITQSRDVYGLCRWMRLFRELA